MITFYCPYGENGYLSNFYRSPFMDETGLSWPTSEHYYQAQKFHYSGCGQDSQTAYCEIRAAISPDQAFSLSRKHSTHVDPAWEHRKVDVMRRALQYKFVSHPPLTSRLLETGEAEIYEDSPSDLFWGVKGENVLGKLLMELRTILRQGRSM